MTTIYEGGRDMTFSNNTVHLTGASSVLSIGDSPTVLYNEVWDVGHLQTDGAVVQLMQGEVQGSMRTTGFMILLNTELDLMLR